MMPVYGAAAALLARARPRSRNGDAGRAHVEAAVREELARWRVKPRLLAQSEKFPAFRRARAALVTSGVATLELALAGVPMTVAYKVSPLESRLRFLVSVDSIVLPNLIVGARPVPEFFQGEATPQALAESVTQCLNETPGPGGAACRIWRLARQDSGEKAAAPSARAAGIILEYCLTRPNVAAAK